jgi:hypothetical protein
MAKYKIERKFFEDKTKGWEIWKDISPEERLAALQKMRKLAFELQKNGKQDTRKT